jgi:hypothetical protein
MSEDIVNALAAIDETLNGRLAELRATLEEISDRLGQMMPAGMPATNAQGAPGARFVCGWCNAPFQTMESLRGHILASHDHPTPAERAIRVEQIANRIPITNQIDPGSSGSRIQYLRGMPVIEDPNQPANRVDFIEAHTGRVAGTIIVNPSIEDRDQAIERGRAMRAGCGAGGTCPAEPHGIECQYPACLQDIPEQAPGDEPDPLDDYDFAADDFAFDVARERGKRR